MLKLGGYGAWDSSFLSSHSRALMPFPASVMHDREPENWTSQALSHSKGIDSKLNLSFLYIYHISATNVILEVEPASGQWFFSAAGE